MSILTSIAKFVLIPVFVLAYLAGHTMSPTLSTKVGTAPQYVAAKPTTLYGSGISSTDTSIRLQSLRTPAGTNILTSDLIGGVSGPGSVFYGTIEPATTKKETISCSAVTQNSDGTATLTGCSRGLSFVYPYAASTTLSLPHSGGSGFVISNSPQLYNDILQYVASTSYSGTVDASSIAKGVLEVAIGREAASTTPIGGGNTSAPLALTTTISTSTCQVASNNVLVSDNSGKLAPTCVATSTLVSKALTSGFLVGTTTISSPASTTDAIGQQILYYLVASTTVTSNTSQILIQNLPRMRHFTVFYQLQSDSGSNAGMAMTFNGDTGSTYSESATTTTNTSGASVSLYPGGLGNLASGTTTGTAEVFDGGGLVKAANINAWADLVQTGTAFSRSRYYIPGSSIWATTTAQYINQIKIVPSAGNLVAGSHVEIYGSSF